jgi:hypothetical protein
VLVAKVLKEPKTAVVRRAQNGIVLVTLDVSMDVGYKIQVFQKPPVRTGHVFSHFLQDSQYQKL